MNSHNTLNLDIKVKCFELLAAFLYKGYLPLLKDYAPGKDLFKFLIDELNTAQTLTMGVLPESKYRKKYAAKIK